MKQTTQRLLLLVILPLAGLPLASGGWTSFTIGNESGFGNIAVDHLSDGRFIYGHAGNFRQQDSFGFAASTAYPNAPGAGDVAFLAIESDSAATYGFGSFGGTGAVGSFNPGSTATAFTTLFNKTQNYAAVPYGSGGILLGGANGTGDTHAISYVTTDGTTNKVIIDNVSTFSAGLALDAGGNLYVADQDDNRVYRFSPTQVSGAITGSPLVLGNGTLVHQFGVGASLAVDSLGRIWAAGFQENGLQAYDPSTGQSRTFVPDLANTNYTVFTFSDGAQSYVGWVNRQYTGASDIVYGYEAADALVVPEPATAALLLAGLAGLLALRQRRNP